jgi:hypothetical protein
MPQVVLYPAFDGSDTKGNGTYATARTGNAESVTNNDAYTTIAENDLYSGDSRYYIRRGFFSFDTSSLAVGAITITSATLSIYIKTVVDNQSDSVSIVESQQASPTTLAVSDHALFGSTKLAADVAFSSLPTEAYQDFALTNLTTISKTGYTKFCVLSAKDIAQTTPPNTNRSYIDVYFSEEAGTSKDPKLTINYTLNSKPLSETPLATDANLVYYAPLKTNSTDTKGGLNGTDTNITYASQYGVFGGGANLNGSSSKIVVPDGAGVNPTSAMTISCWIKKTQSGSCHFISKDDVTNRDWGFYVDDTLLAFFTFPGGNYNQRNSSTVTALNGWHHVAGTRGTDGVMHVYFDGANVDASQTATTSGNMNNSGNSMFIGERDYSADRQWYGGSICDLAIFNRDLTANEIANLANGTFPATGTTKSLNGVAAFDIKSVNGIVVSSIKSYNGMTFSGTDFHTKAIQLDGSTEYLTNTTRNGVGFTNNYTINIWIYITNHADYKTIVTIGRAGDPKDIVYLTTYPTGSWIADTYGTTQQELWAGLANSSITSGQRYMLTVTYNGSSIKTYKNGVNDNTKGSGTATSHSDATRGIFIGGNIYDGVAYINAKICRVDAWNATLTPTQITGLYNAGEGYKLDLRNQFGTYNAQANLKHQWLLGKDSSLTNSDYVDSGGINVYTNMSGIDGSNIVDF